MPSSSASKRVPLLPKPGVDEKPSMPKVIVFWIAPVGELGGPELGARGADRVEHSAHVLEVDVPGAVDDRRLQEGPEAGHADVVLPGNGPGEPGGVGLG